MEKENLIGLRINIGCGQTPTKGWLNYDNSLSLRLAIISCLPSFLYKLKLINSSHYQFLRFCQKNEIIYGDARTKLPIKDATVDVLYSSHMLEHLDRNEASKFLKEAFRMLRPGGIIRIVVPDINKQIALYNISGDANALIESTLLCEDSPKTFLQRLRFLATGKRNHQWMYDGNSLSNLLKASGFINTEILPIGKTRICQHEPLDLYEGGPESVYVEAEKPTK